MDITIQNRFQSRILRNIEIRPNKEEKRTHDPNYDRMSVSEKWTEIHAPKTSSYETEIFCGNVDASLDIP